MVSDLFGAHIVEYDDALGGASTMINALATGKRRVGCSWYAFQKIYAPSCDGVGESDWVFRHNGCASAPAYIPGTDVLTGFAKFIAFARVKI